VTAQGGQLRIRELHIQVIHTCIERMLGVVGDDQQSSRGVPVSGPEIGDIVAQARSKQNPMLFVTPRIVIFWYNVSLCWPAFRDSLVHSQCRLSLLFHIGILSQALILIYISRVTVRFSKCNHDDDLSSIFPRYLARFNMSCMPSCLFNHFGLILILLNGIKVYTAGADKLLGSFRLWDER
jgi:hypothetical protein